MFAPAPRPDYTGGMRTTRIASRFPRLAALGLLLLLGLFSRPAAAELDIPDWRVELRPGFAWTRSGDEDLAGMSVGVMAAYRLFDTVSLKLDGEWLFFDIDRPGEAHWIETTLGVAYDVDLTPLLPTLGAGVGPLFIRPTRGEPSTEAVWHVLLALSYLLTEDFALGLEIRPHFILTRMNQDPFFLTLAAKLMLVF